VTAKPTLSPRQEAALRALAACAGPVSAADIAWLMSDAGTEATIAQARGAVHAVARKGLAEGIPERAGRYQITPAGRDWLALSREG
jgi:hypothetical protein